MSGRKVDLFILESIWDDKLVSETSVRPFFDGLSRVDDFNYIYHTFYDERDIHFFIKESKQQRLACSNYYIAAHGSQNSIHGMNNRRIKTEELIKIFKNFRGRGIYFGSCNFINPKNSEEILNNTWISAHLVTMNLN